MTNVAEAINNQTVNGPTLKTGLDTLSQQYQLTFIKYVKLILPLDGFVFWVKADLLTPSAQYNAANYNRLGFNEPKKVSLSANQVRAMGSLHHSIINQMNEDQSVAVNRMVFTSEIEITDLNSVSPMVMYIAKVDGERFSFSERRSFYKQSNIYHYAGDAIYPTMESQIIDSLEALDVRNVVVSNSLPIWLTLNQFCPVYPSYLVADNLPPPFASVHIDPKSTQPLQSAPLIDSEGSHWQLVTDDVNITLFGLRNFSALDFQDYVYQFMLDTDIMGLMEPSVVRDEKQWQTELSALAMKKSIDFKISYNQARIRDVARQFIKKACMKFYIGSPKPPMIFGFDLALPYEGPFGPGERLPAIVFINTTTLARGVAYTESTGNGVFEFYDGEPSLGGRVMITVTCTADDHYPQITFPNGPVTFYINQVLIPFAPSVTDDNLLDLTITFADVPFTWPS